MKRKILFAALTCLTACGLFQVVRAQAEPGEWQVNDFIKRQARQNRADENVDSRVVLRGDVNGDGKMDIVAQYTLEGFGGGNLYLQYLAVFLGNGKGFRYATHKSVGGKDNRTVSLDSVKGGKIYLETLEYLPDDASCCPSQKGSARFIFSQGKLKEIK